MNMFAKLGWFLKQEKKSYIIGITMLTLLSLITGFVPLILGRIIDTMASHQMQPQSLLYWVLLLITIAIVQYAMRYVWRMAIFGTSAQLEQILRARLFHHFMRMDKDFFHKYRTGDLMARTTNDLGAIRMVAAGGILTLVDSLSQGLITLFMMFFVVDWKLSLITIIPIPFLAIIINYIGRQLHYYSKKAQVAFAAMNDKVQESVTGMKVIKTFGEEERDIQDFKDHTFAVVQANQKVYVYNALFRPSSQLIMGISTILALFFGGFQVVQGQLTVGLLVAFISYITRLTWPMIAVGQLFNILQRGAASYDRIEEILEERSHIIESPNPIQKPIQAPLEFDIAAFSYERNDSIELKNCYFKLEANQTLGIVGKTGSGKSTIFHLLMREYDDYQGQIAFANKDIKQYSLDSLLNHIGYVPQDTFLFSTSILENIRYAKPTASQDEVERAAKLAAIHQDILEFPEGYQTLVGERGVALSGGQKQRIAIARALLIDLQLLILDDALSAVDAKTEEAILDAVKESSEDRMTIISAHRISSVMHAQEILVLEDGCIVERGNHQELLALDGWYAKMYHQQELNRLKGDEVDGSKFNE